MHTTEKLDLASEQDALIAKHERVIRFMAENPQCRITVCSEHATQVNSLVQRYRERCAASMGLKKI